MLFQAILANLFNRSSQKSRASGFRRLKLRTGSFSLDARKRVALLVVSIAAITSLSCGSRAVGFIYLNDFEDNALGLYDDEDILEADWSVLGVSNSGPKWDNGVTGDGDGDGIVSITNDPVDSSNQVLAVTYPLGRPQDNPNDDPDIKKANKRAKAQWKMRLVEEGTPGYEDLFLSYRVRFGEGFNFVKGGKLPGLIGGKGNTGGKLPTGTDGWSARMMWRNGTGGAPDDDGETASILQYVYHPDLTGGNKSDSASGYAAPNSTPPEDGYGRDFRWDYSGDPASPQGDWKIFESGAWYQLKHRIKMNTLKDVQSTAEGNGNNDGIIQAWLDGELVMDVQNIRFRDSKSLAIDQLYFSTFFGGSNSGWAPSTDQTAYFDDFVISTPSIRPSYRPPPRPRLPFRPAARPALTSVPEPGSQLLALIGATWGALSQRRKRR